MGSASAADSDELAWLCVDKLTGAIHDKNTPSDQVHRLRLTLASLIAAVNVPILPRVLDRVELQLTDAEGKEQEELWKAVNEVMDKVGDKGKELSLRWWLVMKDKLDNNGLDSLGGTTL